MNKIKWVSNELPKTENSNLNVMSPENVAKAASFHKSFPEYSQTPLAKLDNMAEFLGLKNVFVKDESYRFGLNAFKVLGGSFAIACYIAEKLGKDISELDYDTITSEELLKEFGQTTFFTATDGNHGRGLAWAANRLSQKSVVFMPKGSSEIRLKNIQKENATATIEEVNYDECVRIAIAESAKTPNSVVIQDTAWEGYEKIPSWIMQGYGTMAMEANNQLHDANCDAPTHIFIQAGVGSLAGAVQGYFANAYTKNPPIVVIVEPNKADCLYRSANAKDGNIRTVTDDMQTIMAGLACGEPNTISWDILKNNSSFFVSCPDYISAKGMRILSSPIDKDPRVISGESGAVTTGILFEIMKNDDLKDLKNALKLDENSKVLLFSTEGNTDPDVYRNIVWDGAYPSI
ncbi:diaminopropionate ammonia-lyase [Clostridium grantii]|uniref:Diaminopropionate ammonia-lyase n=1 Tax=Clostridium grantii DSM 8605 TaxID=1121316 RepID=A0A1M5QYB8_9CLOT|nr:diaminopropionate ammonia-lyase [Clostridium grantii]SHH19145.1 diaminopropionate ammonia-lyase [Clostridium grantii DSM 8605]